MAVLRRALCLVVGHNQTRHRYPAAPGQDAPEGWFLKCVRCGKITESEGLPPGPMTGGF